jgi:hypothetical protein
LSDSYVHLALNGDGNCKKSIAASLHCISSILQEKATELLPILLNYLNSKQLRGTIMSHIAETLQTMDSDSIIQILDPLKSLAKDKNFRTRMMLATKLGELSVLFKPHYCFKEF